jgi:hypothetical protein
MSTSRAADQQFVTMEPKELDVLKHLHTPQFGELHYRRTREFQIFTWSATILLAITGALLVKAQGSSTFLAGRGVIWRFLASAVVLGLTLFSVKWQLEQRKWTAELQSVLATIATKLRCFDAEAFDGPEPLYPDKWKKWGTRYVTLRKQLTRPSKISATLLLGIMAFTSIWLS